jgi:hypothetical protein
MSKSLPARPSLEQLQKQAKELLRQYRAGDAIARQRIHSAYPGRTHREAALADAQFALAREYGFETWATLKHSVEAGKLRLLDRYEQMAEELAAAYNAIDSGAIQRLNDVLGTSISPDQLRARVQQRLRPLAVQSSLDSAGARLFIAQLYDFESWADLVKSISHSPATPSAPFCKMDRREHSIELRPPLLDEDWDAIFDVMRDLRITSLNAGGQMTDAVLERLVRVDQLTSLNLSGSKRVTDAGLGHLRALPRLERLELTGCPITDAGLEVLRHLGRLRGFFLYHHRGVTDTGLANLSFCDQLERVDLMGTNSGDGAIQALAGKLKLRHFKAGNQVTDNGLAFLHQFPVFKSWQGGDIKYSLMEFEAEPNYLLLRGSFGDKGLESLAGLDGLFALNIEGAITPSGLKPLADLANLGWLGFKADDEAMAYISQLPCLRMLMCQDTEAGDGGFTALSKSTTIEYIWGRRCYNLTGRGFSALSEMPALRGLSVSCRNVDDAALSTLPRFPALVEYMPMEVPDEGFRHVGRCGKLKGLWCMYCRDTGDTATEHIAGLSGLKTYYAGQTGITDRSLATLSRMESLEKLTFWACAGITNEGVALLAGLPRLREVNLESLPQVTRRGAALFPPQVRVNYWA